MVSKWFKFILFCIYILFLVLIIVFNFSTSLTGYSPYLNPYHPTTLYDTYIILAVILFIPVGVFLKLFDISLKSTLIWGAIISIVLERLRMAISVKAGDVFKILLNILGVFIGACICLFIKKITDKVKS